MRNNYTITHTRPEENQNVTYTGKPKSNDIKLHAEAGYIFKMDNTKIVPIFGVDYFNSGKMSYTETGGDNPQKIDQPSHNYVRGRFNLKLAHDMHINKSEVFTVYAMPGVVHTFKNPEIERTASNLNPNGVSIENSYSSVKTLFSVDAGVQYATDKYATGIGYTGVCTTVDKA